MNKIKLGDVLDVKRGTSLSGDFYSKTGEFVRLTLGNFKYPESGFKFNTSKDDIYFIGEVKPEYIMKKGDIITPLTEQVKGLLGNTATIPESDKYIQSGDVGKIIPNESVINKRFSYYLISSPIVKKQLSAASQQTKIRHTSPDKIKDCIAFIPNLYQQKRIAYLLDAINSLIQVNNSSIEQLESMAKTIYDYWFLQFEFPNEDGKPYKSSGGKMVWNEELKREIPEGWGVSQIEKLLGKYPKTTSVMRDDYKKGTIYPIIDQSQEYICGYTDDIDKVLHMKSAIVFGDHTNIAKYVNFDFARGADGTQIVNSNNEAVSNYMLYLQICELPVIEQGYSRHFKFLKEQKVVVPRLEISKKYDSKIDAILTERRKCIQENRELASLRDFLLPLLMNGQVTFKEEL